MQTYIGTKQIKAKPMNRLEYNEYRGRSLPGNECGDDPGYLVEYVDSPDSTQKGMEAHEGYVSWSPEEIFEDSYVKISGLCTSAIMAFFTYEHLPPHLRTISMPFAQLASQLDALLPVSAEKSAGLRKLLEAKDCAVRAAL